LFFFNRDNLPLTTVLVSVLKDSQAAVLSSTEMQHI
jgi:hypothetical protein